MYIQPKKQNNFPIKKSTPSLPPRQEPEMIEAPEEELIAEHSEDVLAHWRAPEYEIFERDQKWYISMSLFLLAVISWAVYTNSPVMAITFILIGVSGYIHLEKDPEIVDFMITYEGVVSGREIYDFDNIHSFWILYEPGYKKAISLHMKSGFVEFIHIPLLDENPLQIRKILLQFLPEEKHRPGMNEVLGRVLKIH